MDTVPLMASERVFKQRGQSGIEISDLFEKTAQFADDLAVVRSCYHDGFTHVIGQTWMNSGWGRVGRPSLGSWVVYGLGSESEELPAFMVMLDGGIKAGASAYSSGFLPASYQGAVLRTDGSPILNVNRPAEIGADRQRKMLDLLHKYNAQYSEARTHYTELAARMESGISDRPAVQRSVYPPGRPSSCNRMNRTPRSTMRRAIRHCVPNSAVSASSKPYSLRVAAVSRDRSASPGTDVCILNASS